MQDARGRMQEAGCNLVCLLSCFLLSCSLASCTFPGSTSPTFKIGLVAPFEGRYRAVGYDAIYAARLAVRQANRSVRGVGGYRIELIAYDDGGEPETAARQASLLALDPAVIGVVGHLRPETTRAAEPVYAREGLPLFALAEGSVTGTEQFIADYTAVSGGAPPGPYAWATYQAVQTMLEAAGRDIQSNGAPSREGTEEQLRVRSR